jgi:hypothetical protein
MTAERRLRFFGGGGKAGIEDGEDEGNGEDSIKKPQIKPYLAFSF